MKIRKIILPALMLFIFSACNKEKKLSNNLEGTWNITASDTSGTGASPFIWEMTFANCPENNNCDGSWYIESVYDTSTIIVTWSLDKDIITMGNSSGYESFLILDWDDQSMKWQSETYPDEFFDLMRIK